MMSIVLACDVFHFVLPSPHMEVDKFISGTIRQDRRAAHFEIDGENRLVEERTTDLKYQLCHPLR